MFNNLSIYFQLIKNLTSTEYAESIRQLINDTRTYNNYEYYGAHYLDDSGQHGTAHISIVAPNGDAVSVTSSINY